MIASRARAEVQPASLTSVDALRFAAPADGDVGVLVRRRSADRSPLRCSTPTMGRMPSGRCRRLARDAGTAGAARRALPRGADGDSRLAFGHHATGERALSLCWRPSSGRYSGESWLAAMRGSSSRTFAELRARRPPRTRASRFLGERLREQIERARDLVSAADSRRRPVARAPLRRGSLSRRRWPTAMRRCLAAPAAPWPRPARRTPPAGPELQSTARELAGDVVSSVRQRVRHDREPCWASRRSSAPRGAIGSPRLRVARREPQTRPSPSGTEDVRRFVRRRMDPVPRELDALWLAPAGAPAPVVSLPPERSGVA